MHSLRFKHCYPTNEQRYSKPIILRYFNITHSIHLQILQLHLKQRMIFE